MAVETPRLQKAVIKFLAEVALSILGLAFFWNPMMVSMTGALAIGGLIYLGICIPDPNRVIPMLIESINNRSVRTTGRFVFRHPFKSSLILSLLIWVTLGGVVRTKMWDTGKFGEPPKNRIVSVRLYESNDVHKVVLEISVAVTPINPAFALGFESDYKAREPDIGPYYGRNGRGWCRRHEMVYAAYVPICTDGRCRVVTDLGQITRTTSFYYELSNDVPFTITDLYIEAPDENEETRWKKGRLDIRFEYEGESCDGFTQLDPRTADWGWSR